MQLLLVEVPLCPFPPDRGSLNGGVYGATAHARSEWRGEKKGAETSLLRNRQLFFVLRNSV